MNAAEALTALLRRLDEHALAEYQRRKGWEHSRPPGGPYPVPPEIAEAALKEAIYRDLAHQVRQEWDAAPRPVTPRVTPRDADWVSHYARLASEYRGLPWWAWTPPPPPLR